MPTPAPYSAPLVVPSDPLSRTLGGTLFCGGLLMLGVTEGVAKLWQSETGNAVAFLLMLGCLVAIAVGGTLAAPTGLIIDEKRRTIARKVAGMWRRHLVSADDLTTLILDVHSSQSMGDAARVPGQDRRAGQALSLDLRTRQGGVVHLLETTDRMRAEFLASRLARSFGIPIEDRNGTPLWNEAVGCWVGHEEEVGIPFYHASVAPPEASETRPIPVGVQEQWTPEGAYRISATVDLVQDNNTQGNMTCVMGCALLALLLAGVIGLFCLFDLTSGRPLGVLDNAWPYLVVFLLVGTLMWRQYRHMQAHPPGMQFLVTPEGLQIKSSSGTDESLRTRDIESLQAVLDSEASSDLGSGSRLYLGIRLRNGSYIRIEQLTPDAMLYISGRIHELARTMHARDAVSS